METINDKVLLYRQEYEKLLREHELLAILRSYGIEDWEHWNKAIEKLDKR